MDLLRGAVISSSWLVFCVVWLALAARVKTAARSESLGSKVAHLLPLFVAFTLLFSPPSPWLGFLDQRFAASKPWIEDVGTLLAPLGIGFAIWARLCLGSNWSATVMQKKGHELIQSGPFRLVRHPIYTGMLTAMLGPALAIGLWRGLLAVAIAYVSLWRKYRLEERYMVELFGDQYITYRRRVPALIPFLV